ncbi:MAG: TetR/AcrR family transcriptional regulator [Bacteroidia bacterium]|nr:TetR/AcrR family transcriptional regulator [Bacteroidales bacterium]MDD3961032.1 TetR/AcrR family transcriptional regulator [Bacteroidales bacterium]MDY0286128.1 TetR/AcrR family transcriptional regulator [Bacteroidales bacterium]NCD43546.1 TetR/AcrR family transcriptional regulator [Bacteroidia bacterium]
MMNETVKQKQIRETGQKLFWKHGIKRVTIEEICQTANTSKATFYKYFKNKNDLILHMLRVMFDEAMGKYVAITESGVNYEKKIEAILELKMAASDQMSPELYEELYVHPDKEIQNFLTEATTNTMQIVLKDMQESQKKGEIRDDLRPHFILWYLNKLTEMIKEENLPEHFGDPKEIIRETLTMFYYGVLAR